MAGFDPLQWFIASAFAVPQRLSAAGRMLDQLDAAEKRVQSEAVDEELQAALRRADILSRREVQ